MYLIVVQSGLTGGVYNTNRICTPGKVIQMLHGCLVHVGKTSTDLQIFDCELHKNAFGGRVRATVMVINAPEDE